MLVDLFNREIIGYSEGENKTAKLVKAAFQSVEGSLEDIRLFHTDRGNEFKNQTIEELWKAFHIERSLSHKGCPYDNAVAEATFKIIKTEFVWNETFADRKELKLKLWYYVNWYNHHRIHSSLGYQTPVQYRKNNLKKLSENSGYSMKILQIIIRIRGEYMVSYKYLWELMEKRNISTYTLITKHGFNPRTINNLKHDRGITVYTLERLCKIISCTPNDIISFLPEEDK